nr:peptidase M23 [Sulfurospirillum sp.]
MRIVPLLLTLSIALFSATSVEKKIDKNQKNLKTKIADGKNISSKLNDVAKDILKEKKKLKDINSQIANLRRNINKNENTVKSKVLDLKDLTIQNTNLMENKKKLEKKIIKVIAEDFSFYLISDKNYQDSSDNILAEEVVNKIGIIMQKEFLKLSHNYDEINKKISIQNSQIKNIKTSIKKLK